MEVNTKLYSTLLSVHITSIKFPGGYYRCWPQLGAVIYAYFIGDLQNFEMNKVERF